jgi:hypothetical protein
MSSSISSSKESRSLVKSRSKYRRIRARLSWTLRSRDSRSSLLASLGMTCTSNASVCSSSPASIAWRRSRRIVASANPRLPLAGIAGLLLPGSHNGGWS